MNMPYSDEPLIDQFADDDLDAEMEAQLKAAIGAILRAKKALRDAQQ